MKEVDIIPEDPKSVECIKQLEQVILWSYLSLVYVLVAIKFTFASPLSVAILELEIVLEPQYDLWTVLFPP